jgi:hypothetical protein
LRDGAGALRLVEGLNRLGSAHRFALDPALLFEAARANARLVALYHSHPEGPAVPSPTDRAALATPSGPLWPGVEHWIAAPGSVELAPWGVARFAWCPRLRDLIPAEGPLPLGLNLGADADR